MTDYKATPAQWEYLEHLAPEDGDAACLLELRSRIEKLELGTAIHDPVAEQVRNMYLLNLKEHALISLHLVATSANDNRELYPHLKCIREALEALGD